MIFLFILCPEVFTLLKTVDTLLVCSLASVRSQDFWPVCILLGFLGQEGLRC